MSREEFLKFKNQSISNLELEQKIHQGIDQAENDLGVTLDDDYFDNLNQKINQRLADLY